MKIFRNIYTKDVGQTDYLALATANFVTGQQPFPASLSRYMALFTAAPTDAGTGGTEVSGGSYARVQISGTVSASSSWTTSSSTITLPSIPSWLSSLGTNGSGVNVYDITNNQQIGVINFISGSTVTLLSNALSASSGSSDNLLFSAFPPATGSVGLEPTVTPVLVSNSATIVFPMATANWGTVIVFAIFDSASSGNMIMWDYLGNYGWLPTSISSSSPAVMTTHAHGYNAGDPVVATIKFGGTLPSFSQSNLTGILNVSGTNLTIDTFNVTNSATAVNTSSTGDVMFRKIVQQQMPMGITVSFNAVSTSGPPAFNFSVSTNSQFETLL